MIRLLKRATEHIAEYTYGAGMLLAGIATFGIASLQGYDPFVWIMFPYSINALKFWVSTILLGLLAGTLLTLIAIPFAMLCIKASDK